MVRQRDVLTFIAKRATERAEVNAHDLAGAFWPSLSLPAACDHLRRLWRDRLIESASPRAPKFRFRLEPGEPILPLRFRVAARGRERLAWYTRQDENDGLVGLLR